MRKIVSVLLVFCMTVMLFGCAKTEEVKVSETGGDSVIETVSNAVESVKEVLEDTEVEPVEEVENTDIVDETETVEEPELVETEENNENDNIDLSDVDETTEIIKTGDDEVEMPNLAVESTDNKASEPVNEEPKIEESKVEEPKVEEPPVIDEPEVVEEKPEVESTASFEIGEKLSNYKCVDSILGDITDKVVLRESGGILYYGVVDGNGNYVEISKEITGDNKVIYLTFDDGPSAYTEGLLDTLKKYNVPVTFFVVGTSGYLHLLPRMEAEGHAVAAHTYSHEYAKCYASVDAYFEDLQKVEDKIVEQLGHETDLVRFPGGSSNTVSCKYSSGLMTKLSTEVQNRGYQYFDWNVSSGDAGETTSTSVVLSNVKSGISNKKVAVVLQHDIKKYSVAAVEDIVKWGLEKGYIFLPLNINSTSAHHRINN